MVAIGEIKPFRARRGRARFGPFRPIAMRLGHSFRQLLAIVAGKPQADVSKVRPPLAASVGSGERRHWPSAHAQAAGAVDDQTGARRPRLALRDDQIRREVQQLAKRNAALQPR